MRNRIGPKRRKGGSGLVGMGLGNLAQGGGTRTRKLPSAKSIQKYNEKVGVKSVKLERQASSFAARARAAKTNSN